MGKLVRLESARARRERERGRDLALLWHVIHTIIALIGVGWSWYWWRKGEPVETHA